jgi:hypothetical protein
LYYETNIINLLLYNMETIESVEQFLNDLIIKIRTFRIIFEDRDEFWKLQKELEITQSDCIDAIKDLDYTNYYKGPKKDVINKGEYWEFGKSIKNTEIYIKINKGLKDKPVICISFHKAKFKINYPLRKKK